MSEKRPKHGQKWPKCAPFVSNRLETINGPYLGLHGSKPNSESTNSTHNPPLFVVSKLENRPMRDPNYSCNLLEPEGSAARARLPALHRLPASASPAPSSHLRRSPAPSPTGCTWSSRTTPRCGSRKSGCTPTTWMISSKPASRGRANPTLNKTQQHHVGIEGTTFPFATYKPTTKKAGKDKYPFKQTHSDTLRNVVDSKDTMSLPNYSLTSHSPYRWKPELIESEDTILPIPMCHALPLIGTS